MFGYFAITRNGVRVPLLSLSASPDNSLTTTAVGLHGRWWYLMDDLAMGHGGACPTCAVQQLTLNQ